MKTDDPILSAVCTVVCLLLYVAVLYSTVRQHQRGGAKCFNSSFFCILLFIFQVQEEDVLLV